MQADYNGINLGKVFFYTIAAAAFIGIMIYYMRSKKPALSAFKGMSSGAAALLAVHFLGGYAGLSLPLNFFTTVVSLILGIPGVAFMTLIERLMGNT